MTAYVVFCLQEVSDPEALAHYRRVGGPSLPAYGGRFLGGPLPTETLEGTPLAGAILTEFDTVEAALKWYNSPEYQAAVPTRQAASKGFGFVLQGRA